MYNRSPLDNTTSIRTRANPRPERSDALPVIEALAGTTRSILLSVLCEAALRFPKGSVAAAVITLARTSPLEMTLLTATFQVSSPPVIDMLATVTFAVDPASEISEAVRPVTGSEKITIKLTGCAVAGSTCPIAWSIATVGTKLSTVIEAFPVEAVLGLPRASLTAPAMTLAVRTGGQKRHCSQRCYR